MSTIVRSAHRIDKTEYKWGEEMFTFQRCGQNCNSLRRSSLEILLQNDGWIPESTKWVKVAQGRNEQGPWSIHSLPWRKTSAPWISASINSFCTPSIDCSIHKYDHSVLSRLHVSLSNREHFFHYVQITYSRKGAREACRYASVVHHALQSNCTWLHYFINWWKIEEKTPNPHHSYAPSIARRMDVTATPSETTRLVCQLEDARDTGKHSSLREDMIRYHSRI